MPGHPLILTVAIDAAVQAYFTGLRNLHFPRHCNYLEAHITLFHHLPADPAITTAVLQQACQQPAFDIAISGIKNIGNGVAFSIVSAELQQLHKTLQQAFDPYLISQDRHTLWPHITVQNKVTAFKAKQTAELLSQDFTPFTVPVIGIDSWLYLGGPWQKQAAYRFEK